VTTTVVIPVKDGEALLPACLDAVLREADPSQVVVVDDGSADRSAELAERRGVTLIRRSGGGPYGARNEGWRSTDSELVVFTDSRCRPHSGWLTGLRAALDDPGVAIAGGDVVAQTGPGPAQRYVAKWQPLAPSRGLSHPFMPFLPTCNIVTRRSVLEAVGGFRELRSGGDLDFCWRVQLAGLGTVAYAPGAGVDWVPRETVREVYRQWYRYGAAKPALWSEYRQHGLEVEPLPSVARQAYGEARALLRGLRRSPVREWDVEVVDRLAQIAFSRGYRKQLQAVLTSS
jgi:glycosyltransferase involved in cell wall biosynthesis